MPRPTGTKAQTRLRSRPITTPNAYFFGYGSLVNRDTHGFEGAQTATLTGWRRTWRHTTLRQIAYLTAVPDPTCTIDGLIAPVPDHDWAALDQRERAYARVPAAHQVTHALTHQPEIAVYAIPDGHHSAPNTRHAVLLSYLDVVVQGYLREFGEPGVTRFFDTTQGWDAPMLDDRANPSYPRHCTLRADETALVDHHLRRLGVTLLGDENPTPWRE